jgi:hypothetical protein
MESVVLSERSTLLLASLNSVLWNESVSMNDESSKTKKEVAVTCCHHPIICADWLGKRAKCLIPRSSVSTTIQLKC